MTAVKTQNGTRSSIFPWLPPSAYPSTYSCDHVEDRGWSTVLLRNNPRSPFRPDSMSEICVRRLFNSFLSAEVTTLVFSDDRSKSFNSKKQSRSRDSIFCTWFQLLILNVSILFLFFPFKHFPMFIFFCFRFFARPLQQQSSTVNKYVRLRAGDAYLFCLYGGTC